ncbi:hypothetical protein OFM21_31840, partial [Escherichia coli]|nr:hypothetical protein [Escherichia coli]
GNNPAGDEVTQDRGFFGFRNGTMYARSKNDSYVRRIDAGGDQTADQKVTALSGSGTSCCIRNRNQNSLARPHKILELRRSYRR